MKKKVLIVLAAVMAICFAACDSKPCYCYETTVTGIIEQQVYTNTDTPCGALSNSSRTCVESNERMDPSEIAWK